MSDWTENDGCLEIDYRPENSSGGGCFAYFAFALFICFVGIMSLLLYALDMSVIAKSGVGLLLLLFSLVGGHTLVHYIRGSGSLDLQDILRIDTKTEELSLINTDTKREMHFGLGEFEFIELRKTKHTRRSGASVDTSDNMQSTYYTYEIYLIKKDGSDFWIYTQTSEEKFLERVTIFSSFLGLEVRDEAEFGLSKPAVSSYSKAIPTDFEGSKWVAENRDERGTLYTLNYQKYTLAEKVVLLALFTIFTIIPVLITMEFIVPILSEEPPSSPTVYYAAWIFTSLFYMMYFGIVFLLFVGQFSRYFIRLNENEVDIRLYFSMTLADNLFGKYFRVPKDELRIAAVHRTYGGNYWLSLATKSHIKPESGSRFFSGEGLFQSNQPDPRRETEYLLGLWSLSGVRYRKGATPQDLAYIAQNINEKYGLTP